MATQLQRELPDEQVKGTPEEGEETALAQPDEQLEMMYRLSKLAEYTVRPGLLRLPVSDIRGAENSEKMVIELDHPTRRKPIRKFFDEPDIWSKEAELVQFMDWYGYNSRNIYQLKTDRIYVEKVGEDEWEWVEPPDEIMFYISHKAKSLKSGISRGIKKKTPYPLLAMGHVVKYSMEVLLSSLMRRFRWAFPRGSYSSLGAFVVSGYLIGTVVSMIFSSVIPPLPTGGVGMVISQIGGAAIGLIWGLIILTPPSQNDPYRLD